MYIIIISHIILVISFLYNFPVGFNYFISFIIVISSIILFNKKPINALSTLPYSFLSASFIRVKIGSFSLNLADVLILLLLIFNLLKSKSTKKVFDELFVIFLFMIFLSYSLSIDLSSSTISLIGLLEFLTIYYITYVNLHDDNDSMRIIWGWLCAVTLSSILVIISYFLGRHLLINIDSSFSDQFSDLIKSSTILYRASFFVTSFIFPHALTIVILTIMIISRLRKNRTIVKLFLIINLIALVLLGNKSEIGAIIIAVVFFIFWKYKSTITFKNIFWAAIILIIISFGSFELVAFVMPFDQFQLFIDRFQNSDSFSERLYVWKNILTHLFNDPQMFLIGLGPDIAIRNANSPFFKNLFTAGGVQQGAADNGYLDMIISYGLLLTTVIVIYYFKILQFLFNMLKTDREIFTLIFFPFLTWVILSFTQVHGIAKPVMMLIQYFAIIQKFKDTNYNAT